MMHLYYVTANGGIDNYEIELHKVMVTAVDLYYYALPRRQSFRNGTVM